MLTRGAAYWVRDALFHVESIRRALRAAIKAGTCAAPLSRVEALDRIGLHGSAHNTYTYEHGRHRQTGTVDTEHMTLFFSIYNLIAPL